MSLADQLPSEALHPLQVAFNLSSQQNVFDFLKTLNERWTFTGENARANVDTLVRVLSPWKHVPAVADLARAKANLPLLCGMANIAGETTIEIVPHVCFLVSCDTSCESELCEHLTPIKGDKTQLWESNLSIRLYKLRGAMVQDNDSLQRKPEPLILLWRPKDTNFHAVARELISKLGPCIVIHLEVGRETLKEPLCIPKAIKQKDWPVAVCEKWLPIGLLSNEWDHSARSYYTPQHDPKSEVPSVSWCQDDITDPDLWARCRYSRHATAVLGKANTAVHVAALTNAIISNSTKLVLPLHMLRVVWKFNCTKAVLEKCAEQVLSELRYIGAYDISVGCAALVLHCSVDSFWRYRATYGPGDTLSGLELRSMSISCSPPSLATLAAVRVPLERFLQPLKHLQEAPRVAIRQLLQVAPSMAKEFIEAGLMVQGGSTYSEVLKTPLQIARMVSALYDGPAPSEAWRSSGMLLKGPNEEVTTIALSRFIRTHSGNGLRLLAFLSSILPPSSPLLIATAFRVFAHTPSAEVAVAQQSLPLDLVLDALVAHLDFIGIAQHQSFATQLAPLIGADISSVVDTFSKLKAVQICSEHNYKELLSHYLAQGNEHLTFLTPTKAASTTVSIYSFRAWG